MERLIRSAIHGLTDITGYIGIGMLPRISESHLHRLELIPLPGNRVLAVMVTDSGLVRSKMIELTETVVEDEMRRISEFLEEAYRDVTFHEIGESFLSILERSKERTRDLLREAMTISRKCFNESCAGELFFEGLPDMMRHNFLNREAAGDLLDLMSDSTRLPEYLSDQMVPEQMRILVGSEIPYPALQHMGMVLGTYEFNGHPSGTLGIIGPMQMDYGRVEGLVRYTAEEVSKKLKKKERSAKSS
jgi:heat-inducible transcriptional repressor